MLTSALIGGGGCSSSSSSSLSSSWVQFKNGNQRAPPRINRIKVSCVQTDDPYKTLRIRPGASESEVKKAFRQLALQYHPDVCRGSNCGVQFHQINEAYDIVMSNLRGETSTGLYEETYNDYEDESFRGMNDPDWDLWEEWMGWEGAGIRDYSSHINPYI
ncbi:DnaJ domain [Dillenia turbinata]|uniref:DnaJ domain n=1 Tax=Dillenia turbinata TaxID=194707 RepID=A0AAN8UIE0_9MAGN